MHLQNPTEGTVMDQTKKRKFGLTNNQLKIIAMVSMVLDHVGLLFFSDMIIFRVLGRIAFPIFAYMIAEGCRYTKNRAKYLGIIAGMGTVFQIPWTFIDENETLHTLKSLGFRTAAMALSDIAIDIDDPQLMAEEKLAVFLGTEGEGLHKQTIAGCDYTVCIPMAHGVDSLNVAAASAVAFWQLCRK